MDKTDSTKRQMSHVDLSVLNDETSDTCFMLDYPTSSRYHQKNEVKDISCSLR